MDENGLTQELWELGVGGGMGLMLGGKAVRLQSRHASGVINVWLVRSTW